MKLVKILSFILLSSCLIFAHKVTPTSHGRWYSGAKIEGSLITLSGSLSQDNDSQTLNYTPKYEWDFSYNGTFSPDTTVIYSSVNHRYGTAGSYTVAIRYTDNDNQQGNIYTFTITIEPLIKRYYYVKDHLGNIRQTLDEGGNIVSAQDYYPFGGIYRAVNTADANDKYKFTEKERDKETDYDYFGARYYDSDLGRWLSVDPLADKYAGWSPYNYAMLNPLRLVDPDGRGGLDILWGFADAVAKDFSGGEWTTTGIEDAGDYGTGRSIGHGFSLVVGAAEQVVGALTAITGEALKL